MEPSFTIWPLLAIVGLLILAGFIFIVIRSKDEEVEAAWPYRCKKYFFSRSEQEFLRALNKAMNHQKFVVFPKVRLADFIEVTANKEEYQSWWNRIRSKHIDFLIWDVEQSKIVLAIELDGNSHNSEKMQARDEFVEKLYTTVGMKLERVRVGENFVDVCMRLSQSL